MVRTHLVRNRLAQTLEVRVLGDYREFVGGVFSLFIAIHFIVLRLFWCICFDIAGCLPVSKHMLLSVYPL
jgi:hypothetical protein